MVITRDFLILWRNLKNWSLVVDGIWKSQTKEGKWILKSDIEYIFFIFVTCLVVQGPQSSIRNNLKPILEIENDTFSLTVKRCFFGLSFSNGPNTPNWRRKAFDQKSHLICINNNPFLISHLCFFSWNLQTLDLLKAVKLK